MSNSSSDLHTLRSADRIRSDLLTWYEATKRDLPWRRTRDPYAVLVSEVMLQQTQAARVAVRFPRFMARFPTAHALASALPAAVLAEWTGLGYNRRALSLRRAAATVSRDGWPANVAGLERLPGVGPYTARAVASLAFGTPVGVVDTNVRRWLVRRFGIGDTPAELQHQADALAAPGTEAEVSAWTHATMEFGATICRSRAPRCGECPIATDCPSRGLATAVPVPRQAPLLGSDRAYRGSLVRLLATVPEHELTEAASRQSLGGDPERIGPELDDAGWERIVAGLERDGLIHRSEGRVKLGAATIDP